MKALKLFLALFVCFSFHGQVIEGRVFNEDSDIIPFADVYVNGGFRTEASGFGVFYIRVQPKDSIRVFHQGLQTENLVIDSLFSDTLQLDFILGPRFREMEEVVVSAKDIRQVFGKKNEHVLDFYPLLNDDFYLLKSYRDEYYLSYETEDSVLSELQLSFRPRELYRDFLGNIHVLSEDSSYQLYFDSRIRLMKPYPKLVFETQLKPVVAEGKDAIYIDFFTHHNQRYFLQYKAKGKDVENLLFIRDSVAETVAQAEYRTLLSLYHYSVPEIENIILNGTWNGDVNQLMNRVTKQQLVWYSKIRSLPMNVASFDHREQLITVDLNDRKLYTLNKKSREKQVSELHLPFREKAFVLQDLIARKLYVGTYESGKVILYLLDSGNASPQKMKGIDAFSFPEKLRIADGWVYFLAPHNQFNKVYKMRVGA